MTIPFEPMLRCSKRETSSAGSIPISSSLQTVARLIISSSIQGLVSLQKTLSALEVSLEIRSSLCMEVHTAPACSEPTQRCFQPTFTSWCLMAVLIQCLISLCFLKIRQGHSTNALTISLQAVSSEMVVLWMMLVNVFEIYMMS